MKDKDLEKLEDLKTLLKWVKDYFIAHGCKDPTLLKAIIECVKETK